MVVSSDSDNESSGTFSTFGPFYHGESDSFVSSSSISSNSNTTKCDQLMSVESSPVHHPEPHGPLTPPVWQRRPVNALKLQVTQPPLSTSSLPKHHAPATCPGAGLSVLESGQPMSLDYSVSFYDSKRRKVSPLHHVNIHAGKDVWTMVCKTPKGSTVKLDCSENEKTEGVLGSPNSYQGEIEKQKRVYSGCGSGPLRPRTENGQTLRFSEVSLWNIGILPQTWASPDLPNIEYGGLQYDGLPIDLFDLGARTAKVGEIYSVKVLAAFAVIGWDCGKHEQQLSWKVLCVRADDLSAFVLDDVGDVNRRMPGVLEEVREWLRICHFKTGECRSRVFGLNERAANREGAIKVIQESHASWQRLVGLYPHLLLKVSHEAKRAASGRSSPLPPAAYPANQGVSWPRMLSTSPRDYYGGEGSSASSPNRPSHKQRKNLRDANGGGSDTESQVSGSGYSTSGSFSKRMGFKTLRSSPHFAHPAYIEPRNHELSTSFDLNDWDEVHMKPSALCFPMNQPRKAREIEKRGLVDCPISVPRCI